VDRKEFNHVVLKLSAFGRPEKDTAIIFAINRHITGMIKCDHEQGAVFTRSKKGRTCQ
jgi:hypothetical protein